jgi:hypothetical protein
MTPRTWLLLVVLLILLLRLAACWHEDVNLPPPATPLPSDALVLPFETILRSPIGERNERCHATEQPLLFVIAEPSESSGLTNAVMPEALAQVQGLDFERYIAIAAFQGQQPYLLQDPEGFTIQRILQEGRVITIYAEVVDTLEIVVQAQLVVSPYHLVKVERGEAVQGELEFVLSVDGVEVARETHVIP